METAATLGGCGGNDRVTDRLRFIVIGAGAIGGVVGGRLAQHGHDVILVARGAHCEALRQHGLKIESPADEVQVAVTAADRVEKIDWRAGDVALLAVKTQDSEAALRALAQVAPAATPIVCLQNGVASERMALRRFANVYGVCVMCPAGHLEPGVVQAWSTPVTGLLDLGRYPAGADATAENIAAALRDSTFQSEVRGDILRWKYGKLLLNLGNAFEALGGSPAARQSPLVARARAEAVACFAAAGIDYVGEEEDAARRGEHMKLGRIRGEKRGGGSSWQSLTRATGNIESDYLNGEIVLLGRLHGVPTPVNEGVRRLANEVAAAGGRPGSLSLEEIERRLAS